MKHHHYLFWHERLEVALDPDHYALIYSPDMVGQQTSLPVAGLGVQLHDPEDVLGSHLRDALLQ